MRKLRVGCLVTLDGVHGSPRSWASPYFDDEAAEKSLAQLRHSDAMLMGRSTYEYFVQSWPHETGPYPDRVNEIRKYVFSSTLTTATWTNAVVVADDPADAVAELKRRGDGDLVVYGFGRFARTLLDHDLVDELAVSVLPVLHGSGDLLFRPGAAPRHLDLASVERSGSGVVTLTYART